MHNFNFFLSGQTLSHCTLTIMLNVSFQDILSLRLMQQFSVHNVGEISEMFLMFMWFLLCVHSVEYSISFTRRENADTSKLHST